MADWRVATLKALKAPVTKSNLAFLGSWQRWEGGATNNNASYNWLNTTHGSQYPSINSVGVRAYPNFGTGIKILANVLQSGYPTLTKLLKQGNGAAALNDPGGLADLNKWLSGNPSSAPSSYTQKIASTLGGSFPLVAKSSGSPGSGITPTGRANTTGLAPGSPPPSFQAQVVNPLPLSGAGKPLSGSGDFFGQSTVINPGFKAPPVKTFQVKGNGLPPLTVQHDKSLPVNSQSKGVIHLAREYLGTKYVYGGNTPSGFDCSGFVQWVYGHMGVSLPRTTWDQIKVGQAVNPSNLKAGDIVFFNGGEHEALYIGGGRIIEAPHTGDVVKIMALRNMPPVYAARRVT